MSGNGLKDDRGSSGIRIIGNSMEALIEVITIIIGVHLVNKKSGPNPLFSMWE